VIKPGIARQRISGGIRNRGRFFERGDSSGALIDEVLHELLDRYLGNMRCTRRQYNAQDLAHLEDVNNVWIHYDLLALQPASKRECG
jgi:hypothetical protein